MFDWNDLKHFLAVARHGSTIAAAKALSLSQSTVHRRLEELERRLGGQLVIRHPTGYRLTELGKGLQPYAEGVEDAVAAFERQFAATNTELVGSIRVTCPDAVGPRLTRSGLIEKFNARYRELRVELVMGDRIVDLAKGEADIAFRALPPTDGSLFGRKLSSSPWAVYASQAYIERHGKIQRFEDIGEHTVVAFDGSLLNHPAAQWLQTAAPNARVAARSTSLPALLQAIKSGAGVGALPIIVGDAEDDLVRLSGPIPNLATGFYLLMHEDMKTTPRVRAFFDFVVEELATIREILGTEQTTRAKSSKRRQSRPLQ
jgi:DNA-binding transcriptional LysR family regulator